MGDGDLKLTILRSSVCDTCTYQGNITACAYCVRCKFIKQVDMYVPKKEGADNG